MAMVYITPEHDVAQGTSMKARHNAAHIVLFLNDQSGEQYTHHGRSEATKRALESEIVTQQVHEESDDEPDSDEESFAGLGRLAVSSAFT